MPYKSAPNLGIEGWRGLVPALAEQAVLARAGATVIRSSERAVHVPRAASSSPVWLGELTEIDAGSAVPDELLLVPQKCASLTLLSGEAVGDASDGLLSQVTDSVVREQATAVDHAAFTGEGYDEHQPVGLVTVGADLAHDDTLSVTYEGIAKAAGKVRQAGAEPDTAFVSAVDLVTLQLAQDGADRPLLNDATTGTPSVIAGLRIFATSALPEGVAMVAEAKMIALVLREDGRVDISGDSHFTLDGVALRAVSRVDVGMLRDGAAYVIGDLVDPEA